MARYLSQYRAFKKTVRKARQQLLNTPLGPERQEVEPPIIAFFKPGGVTEWEAKEALERFRFKGKGENENVLHRVTYYDTVEEQRRQGWSDQLRQEIEDLLDRGQGQDYFRCDKPGLEIPWPNYSKVRNAEKVAATVVELGLDPEYVVAYERENENRAKVIEALESISAPDEETEVVIKA